MKYVLKYELDKENFVESLLHAKGVQNIERFLNPQENEQHDPFLLSNMDSACNCLIKHMEKRSKMFIMVDSDMDGYMSAAMMYNYIKELDSEIEIAWETHEGKQHGIIMDYIPADCGLVIVPDAGSNDFAQHKLLKERGVDVIIIDHHECEESKDAIVVNNQLNNYPNKSLSGGGVVYKFLQAMDSKLNRSLSENYVDMAAISIVGDMMDLRDLENRYIVKTGLSRITNLGLRQIVEQQAYSLKDTSNLTPVGIAFYVVPLVNALVRVGTDEEKKLLFRSFVEGHILVPSTKRGDKGKFETIATQAVRNCVNARSRQNRAKEKAVDEIDLLIQKNELHRNQVIFVSVDNHKMFDSTLTGLIAMNVLSKYKKPTIVARLNEDGFWRGSARGAGTPELKDLKAFFMDSGFFEYAEGHANAHGVSIHTDNVESFLTYANRKLSNVEFNENSYEVDVVLSKFDPINTIVGSAAQHTNIWGQGVEEPLIVLKDIALFPEDFTVMGSKADTVKFKIDGVECIKFRDDALQHEILNYPNGFAITLVGRANMNEWNGRFTPQIIVEDYELRDNSSDF